MVEAGQLLMRLDETVTRATLGIVRSQLDELTARQARLEAERDDAETSRFPDEPAGTRPTSRRWRWRLASERRLFESRRQARDGQRAQLRERIAQINEEIAGIAGAARRQGPGDQLDRARSSPASSELYRKNLISIQRVMQLQRDEARLEGERGQLTADMARAKGRISEIELQILQLDQDFRTEVLKELREAQGKIAELKERLTAAEDQLKRIDIRAPQSGHRASARGPHRRRRDRQRRDHHADRAADATSWWSRRRSRPATSTRSRSAPTPRCASWPATSAPRRSCRAGHPRLRRPHPRAADRPGLLPGARDAAGGRSPPARRRSSWCPACRPRCSSTPASARRSNICSSRCRSRSPARSASAESIISLRKANDREQALYASRLDRP